MAYSVGKGNAVSILHRCGTLDGSATVSGEAANITTALLDPLAASSANTVTVAEIGTSGYYTISFTPDVTGNWQVTVTNPAGTDEAVSDYAVAVSAAAQVEASSALALTTQARVKERLSIEAGNTDYDDLIDSLISEVSDQYHAELGRIIPEQVYTEYYDGTGRRTLTLRQGPLVSVTSVNVVSYEDAGDGSRDETLTELEEYGRLEGGNRSENYNGLGWIVSVGEFSPGERNYKIVYTAGFDPIPEAIVRAATTEVGILFFSREAPGLISKSLGDGDMTFLSPKQIDDMRKRALRPYFVGGFS